MKDCCWPKEYDCARRTVKSEVYLLFNKKPAPNMAGWVHTEVPTHGCLSLLFEIGTALLSLIYLSSRAKCHDFFTAVQTPDWSEVQHFWRLLVHALSFNASSNTPPSLVGQSAVICLDLVFSRGRQGKRMSTQTKPILTVQWSSQTIVPVNPVFSDSNCSFGRWDSSQDAAGELCNALNHVKNGFLTLPCKILMVSEA